MILVKKRYLFILTVLLCVFVIFGEIKFFTAVKNLNVAGDMQLKYEVENFIFAAIVLILVIFFFFINFIMMSTNLLKRLDKMIDLSEYGKHDISSHLKEMGGVGKRVNYLIHNLNTLNDMKSLKISSLYNISGFLIEKTDESLLLLDCQGKIENCSNKFAEDISLDKRRIKGRNLNEVFQNINFEDILSELEKKRTNLEKEVLVSGNKKKVIFSPIMNADNDISNIVGILI